MSLRAFAAILILRFRRKPQLLPPPAVGIFGKHPAWADHISLPLETPGLQDVRHLLYHLGIQSNIERGTWSELSDAELIPFGHWFCCGQARRWIVGRLWASVDKIGRRDYPMVICIDFADASPGAAVAFSVPILRDLESRCRGKESATDVLTGLHAAKTAARQWEATAVDPAVDAPPTELKSGVLRAWAAVLKPTWIDRVFKRHAVSAAVRVPRGAADAESSLAFWAHFAAQIAGTGNPLFIAAADAQPHVDMIIGPRRPEELSALRRSAISLPAIAIAAAGSS